MSIQLSASNTLAFRMLLVAMEHIQSGAFSEQTADIAQVNFPVLVAPFSDFREVELKGTLTDGGTFKCICKVRKYTQGWLPVFISLSLASKGYKDYPHATLAARFNIEDVGKHFKMSLNFRHQPLAPEEENHVVRLETPNDGGQA